MDVYVFNVLSQWAHINVHYMFSLFRPLPVELINMQMYVLACYNLLAVVSQLPSAVANR